jgi:hypothetical protein
MRKRDLPTGERGKVVGEEPNSYDRKKAWSSIVHSIHCGRASAVLYTVSSALNVALGKQSAKFLFRKTNSYRYTVPLIGNVQTMSQLEAENARLKLTVQETREALDQSKTVEVRTILEDQSHDLVSLFSRL